MIDVGHFQRWIDWATEGDIGLDFNPTFFSHTNADGGFTLSSPDRAIRDFWVEHGKRCRHIAQAIGSTLKTPCTNNFWIPDGWKDIPADRLGYRQRLIEALDEVFAESFPDGNAIDAVESKLFGIGSESFVVGSHDFYLSYALSRGLTLTMDAGHYHPTEAISEKISALLPFFPRLLLHVSRPVRWDSDHVVLFDRETTSIMREIERADAWERVHLAVDFFDASINRISAWVIGLRASLKAALFALLEPKEEIARAEREGRLADRLALLEGAKTLPFAAVWEEQCRRRGVPSDQRWIDEVRDYECRVLAQRE